jgi:hypothetical protein
MLSCGEMNSSHVLIQFKKNYYEIAENVRDFKLLEH